MDSKKIAKALAEPFSKEDIEWRAERCGEKNGKYWVLALAYITNRAIMQRLDEVVGIENWQDEYVEFDSGAFYCKIGIKMKDGWVWKGDGADKTNIEAVKGGFSGAEKRAAVKWGMGRYLYKLEHNFGEIDSNGAHSAKTKDGKWFKWNPPALPTWALPEDEQKNPVEAVKKVFPGAKEITLASFTKMIGEAKDKAAQKEVWKKYADAVKRVCNDEELKGLKAIHTKINH